MGRAEKEDSNPEVEPFESINLGKPQGRQRQGDEFHRSDPLVTPRTASSPSRRSAAPTAISPRATAASAGGAPGRPGPEREESSQQD